MSSLKYTIADCKRSDSAFCAFVAELPSRFGTEGTMVYDKRNVIKVFNFGGLEIVVKRFKRLNVAQRLFYTFCRTNKAEKAYNNAITLRNRGVDTPEAYAYAEVRHFGLLTDAYLVSAANFNLPIEQGLDADAFNHGLACAFARFVAMLHKKGIVHRDLNSTNVLWKQDENGRFSFSLIDVNRIQFYPEGQMPPQTSCFENLTLFTGRMDLFELVAREYVKAIGGSEQMVPAIVAQKHQHDAAWQRRKTFLGKLKSIFQ